MPRLPTLRVSVLAELAGQLRFVPPATARRHVERAEAFLLELDPAKMYDEVALVRRITAYAPEIESPATIVGEALLADLGALIEHLSIRAGYRREELAGWLGVDDLCRRWSVTRRTLERYRREGLAGRRARNPAAPEGNGKEVLLFAPAVVARFQARNSARIEQGRVFSRIDDETARRMVRRAARYRRRFGCTRGQAAGRLAKRFERSPDAVRRLLIRHDGLHAAEAAPIFPEPGPATDKQARVIERALRFRGVGVDPSSLAERFGKSAPSIHRIALEQRAAMLRELGLAVPDATPARDERRGAGPLAVPAANLGLGTPGARTIPEFIERTLEAGWPDPQTERERARAWAVLRGRAAKAIQELGKSPGAGAIDGICVDLLWAARLKAELVRGEGMLLLKTVEARLGTSLDKLADADAASLYHAAIESLIASGDGVDRYDPSKGGRVAAPAGVALNRAISQWENRRRDAGPEVVSTGARRATRMVPAAPVMLEDWTRRVSPWQAWLEPHPLVSVRLDRAEERVRALLRARFGWLEGPPRTIETLAKEAGCRPVDMTRRLRGAMRTLLAGSGSEQA